jgi:predicted nucleic acid-binding Zn ribbon protein
MNRCGCRMNRCFNRCGIGGWGSGFGLGDGIGFGGDGIGGWGF